MTREEAQANASLLYAEVVPPGVRPGDERPDIRFHRPTAAVPSERHRRRGRPAVVGETFGPQAGAISLFAPPICTRLAERLAAPVTPRTRR
jgi:hypothetical protein